MMSDLQLHFKFFEKFLESSIVALWCPKGDRFPQRHFKGNVVFIVLRYSRDVGKRRLGHGGALLLFFLFLLVLLPLLPALLLVVLMVFSVFLLILVVLVLVVLVVFVDAVVLSSNALLREMNRLLLRFLVAAWSKTVRLCVGPQL